MSTAAEQSAEWFNTFEAAHDIVFYRGDAPDSPWTHSVSAPGRPHLPAGALRPAPAAAAARSAGVQGTRDGHGRNCCCCIRKGTAQGLPEHFALRSGLFESHHHVRAGPPDDIERLARFIAGRAVGLVLAGGGARGFAHIGVIKALKEADVPFDHLGGTSMGAIIAAGLALRMEHRGTDRARCALPSSTQQSADRLHAAADRAGARQKGLEPAARDISANGRIEELPKPFFCVSSDLTTGPHPCASRRDRCGGRCAPAWRCRASCRPSPITAICWSMAA